MPRFLAVWGMVGYLALAAGETFGILGYEVGLAHYAPGGLFEVVLAVLLIRKGFPARQEPAGPSAAVPGRDRNALLAP